MKQLSIGVLMLVLAVSVGYKTNRMRTPPDLNVANVDTLLRKTDDGWLYKSGLFSGYMVEKEMDGRVVYQLPIIDGQENGLAKGWYNTGEKLLERLFVEGRKEGQFKQWWPNGQLRYVFQYKNDRYDGLQLVLFPDGRKREESHYLMGEKEGVQRVWAETGDLISNYTIRKGKIYGVVSVKSCIPVAN